MPDFPASEFDEWASSYDRVVLSGQGFPFEGYADLLARMVELAEPRPGLTVLDLGTGTGNLAALFNEMGCEVWGTDFSPEMLKIARVKVPEAKFIFHDLHDPLTRELQRSFNVITSVLVMHHFDLVEKIRIIQPLLACLAPEGRLIIGDISFCEEFAKEKARLDLGTDWEEEFYWNAKNDLPALKKLGVQVKYIQLSGYLGVYLIQNNPPAV